MIVQKANEQGAGTTSEQRYLRHLDLPFSRSISGLDETLQAVKDLLKKQKSHSSLIIQDRQALTENNNPELALASGTTILFREHQRKSLLPSRSETAIPTKAEVAALSHCSILQKLRPPSKKREPLKERRLMRQTSSNKASFVL